MARTDTEQLVVSLEARISDFEKQMRKATNVADRNLGQMQRRADQAAKSMETRMSAAATRVGSSLAGIGKGLAFSAIGALGIQGARDIGRLADEFRGLQNQLRDTGLKGKELDTTFASLFAISQKQGASIGSLVSLYRDAANAGETLNATEADRLKFAEGVANALRIEGKSATEAAGAIQQLGQLLSAGTVRAEEFNSVAEGMRPVLQAVADGITEAGGSIGKLRTLMLDGKVSSEAFFKGFLAGSNKLAERADQAEGRVSGSMNRIGNAMLLLVGHLDEVTGASDNATTNLNAVAGVLQNFPGYIDAAVAGLQSLNTWLDRAGNASVWKTMREAMGISDADLPSYGITPIAPKFPGKAKDDLVPIPQASNDAAISLSDFPADAAASAGAGSKTSFPTGAVSSYVDNVVGAESGGDRHAKNPNSSATGLGQFIESTWLDLFKKSFPDRAASMSRAAILALRTDAEISRTMIEAYATENADVLRSAGVAVNEAALHLSHFLGAGDAAKVLSAAPGTPLRGLISSSAIAANPTILGGGRTVDDAKRYAEGRANKTRVAAGNLNPAEERAVASRKSYDEIIAGAQQMRAEQELERQSLGLTSQAAAKARYEMQLFADAQRAGIELTPEQRAQLSDLAAGMAEVEAATTKAAASQEEMKAVQGFLSNEIGGFFTGIITGATSVEDALTRVLSSLAEAAIQAALFGDGPLGALMGGGAGILGSVFGFSKGGPVKGFATGGHVRGAGTGTSDSIPAALSDGEFVVNARATAKHRALLEAVNSGRIAGFANGGIAGIAATTVGGSTTGGSTFAPTVNVMVEGGSKGAEADGKLAKEIGAKVDAQMRALIADEMRRQTRPGGAFRSR